MFKNICLIGLPYSGKSTIGRIWAIKKNIGFIETDKMIEYKYKCQLKDLIKTDGIYGFLILEDEIIQTLHCENTIISTGGSIVYNSNAIIHLKNNLNCKIIHLHLSFSEFKNRVGSMKERGVINKSNLSLNELYLERIRLCELYSDITINADNKNDTIINLLKEDIYK